MRVVTELLGHLSTVSDVHCINREDIYITASEDQSVRLWVKRENGVFWPCAIEYLDSPVTAMTYAEEAHKLLIGLAHGQVILFDIPRDYNALTYVWRAHGHTARVAALALDTEKGWVMSAGADGLVQLYNLSNKGILYTYKGSGVLHCLAYAQERKLLFVGGSSGDIVGLAVSDNALAMRYSLAGGHKGTVRALEWDSGHSRLFSGGQDGVVCVWHVEDGKEPAPLRLRLHTAPVQSLTYVSSSDQLVSIDVLGKLAVWDMTADRKLAPRWQESDTCELCNKPFFWNVQKSSTQILSFNLPKFNTTRQHHCRLCGRAVCASCAPQKMAVPSYGFEAPVYVCTACVPNVTPEDRKQTAQLLELPGATVIHWVPGTSLFTIAHKDFCAKTIELDG